MTVYEAVSKVKAEKQTPGRFPSRVIFAKNWGDYTALIDDMRGVYDVVLNLADYASGDILPNFKALKQELRKNNNKTILLLSMGEYLRLCAKREQNTETAEFVSIWEPDPVLPESETTKYIIPIFGGRELFDNAISYVDKRQETFLWEIDETGCKSDYLVTIYSPDFAEAVEVDVDSFSAWLAKWDTLFAKQMSSFSLRTKLYKYASETISSVKIRVVSDPFSYVTASASDGDLLRKEYGNDTFWSEVAKNIQANKPFSATIDYVLNIGHSFDPTSVLARFWQISETEKLLFWLRCKMYVGNGYVSFAVSQTSKTAEIPFSIRDTVFTLTKPSESQLKERLNAIAVLGLHYDEGYFAKLDKVLPAESRFAYLTYKTPAEQAYAVSLIGKLLRKGANISALSNLIQQGYPALAEYCAPCFHENDDFSRYFDWYRKTKLMNALPSGAPYLDLVPFDTRNKAIQNSENGYPFWIDGLGVEWLPLILCELKKMAVVDTVDYKVARAILPSETEYNHQWEQGDEKWDRLDKLSHTGIPDDKDYYSCVATQIKYVCEITRRVGELLESHNCVLITGDHGSSRLAALMFHSSDNIPVAPPNGATVRALGRFCELPDDNTITPTESTEVITSYNFTAKRDVKCVVMKTYEHYKQSGNAEMEVHGGATPEEQLVPVIVVKRKIQLTVNTIELAKKRQAVTQNDMGI